MHIAVDAHAIGRRLTGNEVYVRNLLSCFGQLESESRFTAYYCCETATEEIPAHFKTVRVSANPFIRLGFDLPNRVLRDRPDLLHVQYTAPLRCSVPVVTSVHDISFLEHPEYFRRWRALQLRQTVGSTVRSAARILAPSNFSRSGILRNYGVEDFRVVTIPMAVSTLFRPVAREVASPRISKRYGINAPYLLTVGDLQPRKNHIGLIEAFTELTSRHPELNHHLLIAGKPTWYSPNIRAAAQRSGVAHRIHFLGFVSDSELLDLYSGCDVFVFPSLYEGFGIPILEAMACGRAVACSNTSAMPEVANATALLFDPSKREEIVNAMRDLLVDAELRCRMERLSLQRAALFHWNKTARMTLDVYKEVAEEVASVQPFLARSTKPSWP